MAPLIGRIAAALVLLLVPVAGAQQPSTSVNVVATPTGSWNLDGYVDAGSEIARWALNATVVFSQSSFCPDEAKVRFSLIDAEGKAASISTEPEEKGVAVPAGGATKYVEGQALLGLPATLPGMTMYSVRLQTSVGKCPNAVGTQVGAISNLTLTATTLFRPGLDIQYTNRSSEGRFEVTARNTGNGPLLVAIVVAPIGGAPVQPSDVPPATLVTSGQSAAMTVMFPEKKPGRYSFTATGSYNGPDAEKQRRAEFSGAFEILAPIVVKKTKSASGAEAASVAALVVAVAFLRRR